MLTFRKLFLVLLLTFFVFSTHALIAQAQILNPSKKSDFQNNVNIISASGGYSQADTLEVIIARVIRTLLLMVGTIFMVLLFLAGQALMRAGGDSKIVSESKERIQSLLIGLLIILAAYAVSAWISRVFANLIQL